MTSHEVAGPDYDAIARWVYDTCRLFGTSPETASEVAAIFVRHLREELASEGQAA